MDVCKRPILFNVPDLKFPTSDMSVTMANVANMGSVPPVSGVAQTGTTPMQQVDREKMYQWIIELASPETRENALLELR